MSNIKRPRDEASIESLRSILGDVSINVLENLLHRSNNNVELAINLYFTEPQQQQQSSSTNTLLTTKPSKPKELKYYIGDLVITGWSLYKGKSPVKEGDVITIVRDNTAGLGKKNGNQIVRFTANGRELGRLPRDVANYMSILLDQQLCLFEGTIVWCPPILQIGEDMILLIKCYLLPTAMQSMNSPTTQTKKLKQKNSTTIHDISQSRKLALLRMFRQLGLKPVRSSIQRINVVGEEDSRNLLLQTLTAKESEDKLSSTTSHNEGIMEDDEEEEKEVTDDQLDTIYEKAQVFDSQIKPADQPATMAIELKEYQKRALAWMIAKESYDLDDNDIDMRSMHPLWEEYNFPGDFADEHRFFYFNPYSGEISLEFPEANKQERGGILADEMGLGKTIEILSLIHTNRYRHDNSQKLSTMTLRSKKSPTTLIVCPMSLLAQWRDEILRASKPKTITVELFYGDDRSNYTSTQRLCHWDGTAPDILITTYGVLISEWTKSKENAIYNSPIFGIEFWRVVLDEAHQIKNRQSKASQACRDVNAIRRWAVTGTPIQNKLDDLFSLVRFLRHEPWANHTFWNTFITVPFEKKDTRALTAVQTVLEPIVLRRTKAMRDSHGELMVPLPPKTVHIEYLSFSREEQDIYDAIYNDSQIKFSYFCEAGKLGKNYASIFQLLTRLRQICCHPYLALQSKEALKEEIKASNGKGIKLEKLIASKSLEDFSQGTVSSEGSSSYGLSILQNMLALEQYGSSHYSQSQKSNTSMSIDAPLTEERTLPIDNECPICFETLDTMIGMPCMHFACRPCVMDYFQKKENEGMPGECPICRYGPISQSELLEFAQQKVSEDDQQEIDNKDAKSTNDNHLITSKKPTTSGIKFEIQRVVGGFKPSTKMNALTKHLKQNMKENHKTVVFSQFTGFLDLIEEGLNYESIPFTRLDGTQAQAQREKVLKEFTKPDGIDVLLISLRAGGVGLNLTCANRVIMMDPWWNFAIESQAIDRVHRLGQSKDVVVTRFIMRDTVEERILEIQNRKHVLVNELYMSRDENKSRRLDDLQLLFGRK
ncbi:SNF2 family N-terminal domain-containing protein [Cokeromyces recurvatus]|uniref:SNF2 family N-terminal domain-containing protein n=1 Tax=Cokeromyces recurvatus TaxID=90255 RepID=UPI00221F6E54|nr:SNF2 family N-terminal domain-containing protein [Cokeromyces recurvatus]KAI7905546.1 SNF2 family N-terminal domain-containing protein [Cokeromyces recurvatus]